MKRIDYKNDTFKKFPTANAVIPEELTVSEAKREFFTGKYKFTVAAKEALLASLTR